MTPRHIAEHPAESTTQSLRIIESSCKEWQTQKAGSYERLAVLSPRGHALIVTVGLHVSVSVLELNQSQVKQPGSWLHKNIV